MRIFWVFSLDCSEAFEAFVYLVGAGREFDSAPFVGEATVFFDEFRGVRPVGEVGRYGVALHADGEVVTNFEMEVGGIHAEVAADGAELLAALEFLAYFDEHFVKVAVEGIHVFDFAAGGIPVGVADDGNVAPALADVVGEGDDAACAGVDGIAKIGIAAAAAVPIFTEVCGRAQAEATSFVVASGIRFADGEVKAVGEFDAFFFRGGEGGQEEDEGKEANEAGDRPWGDGWRKGG